MLWWEEGFCQMLAEGGRFVIRYDHCDTGRSVTYEPGRPGYTGADLVGDAARVLDAYAIPAAHVVGVSAGGALAQLPRAPLLRLRPLARPDQHVLRCARQSRAFCADRGVHCPCVTRLGPIAQNETGSFRTTALAGRGTPSTPALCARLEGSTARPWPRRLPCREGLP
ncbi:alpha/beta fold hydrolase [Streptomyces sp. NPDC001698]|uniref:alpha/beta fold hydrolase n=1 Tax=Streptomyces sp. NPDC001698 TaxID=3364601 RepID=UPI0036CEEECC